MSEENENKPNLDVPEHLEYSDEHVWVDASTEPAMVGITEYAADQLGELVYIDLPEIGTEVQAGDEVAELESSKAVTPLVTPVAGGIPPMVNPRRNPLCEQRSGRRSGNRHRRSVWRRLDFQNRA